MSTFNLNFQDDFPIPTEVDFSETAEVDDYREYFNFTTSKKDSIDVVSSNFNFGLNSRLVASLNITESLKKIINYIERFTSSLTVSESLSKIVKYNKVLSDSFTINESLSKIIHYIKNLSDSFTTSESLEKIVHYNKVLEDSLTLSDLLEKIMHYIERFTADLVLEDKLFRGFNYFYSSGIDLTEALTVGSHYFITVAEGVLTLTEKIISRGISERVVSSLTLEDIRKELISVRFAASFVVEDFITKIMHYIEVLRDSFSLVEKIIKVGVALSLSSSFVMRESIKYILKRLVDLVDSFSINQKLTPLVGLRISAEFSLSDLLKYIERIVLIHTDSIVITQATRYLFNFGLNNEFNLTDQINHIEQLKLFITAKLENSFVLAEKLIPDVIFSGTFTLTESLFKKSGLGFKEEMLLREVQFFDEEILDDEREYFVYNKFKEDILSIIENLYYLTTISGVSSYYLTETISAATSAVVTSHVKPLKDVLSFAEKVGLHSSLPIKAASISIEEKISATSILNILLSTVTMYDKITNKSSSLLLKAPLTMFTSLKQSSKFPLFATFLMDEVLIKKESIISILSSSLTMFDKITEKAATLSLTSSLTMLTSLKFASSLILSAVMTFTDFIRKASVLPILQSSFTMFDKITARSVGFFLSDSFIMEGIISKYDIIIYMQNTLELLAPYYFFYRYPLFNSFVMDEKIVKVAISELITATLTMVTKVPLIDIYLKAILSLLEHKYFALSDRFTSSFSLNTEIPLIGVNLKSSFEPADRFFFGLSTKLASSLTLVTSIPVFGVNLSSLFSLSEKYNYYFSTKFESTMELVEKEYFVYGKPLKDSFSLSDRMFKLFESVLKATISLTDRLVESIKSVLSSSIILTDRHYFALDYPLKNAFKVSEKIMYLINLGLQSEFYNFDELNTAENMVMDIDLLEKSSMVLTEKVGFGYFFVSTMQVYDRVFKLYSGFISAALSFVEKVRLGITSRLSDNYDYPEEIRFNDDEILVDEKESLILKKYLEDIAALTEKLNRVIHYTPYNTEIPLEDEFPTFFAKITEKSSEFLLSDEFELIAKLSRFKYLVEMIDSFIISDVFSDKFYRKIIDDVKLLEVQPKKNIFRRLLDKFYMLTRFEFALDSKLISDNFEFNELRHFNLRYLLSSAGLTVSEKLVNREVFASLFGEMELSERISYLFGGEMFLSDSIFVKERVKDYITLKPFIDSMVLFDVRVHTFNYFILNTLNIYDRFRDIPKEIILVNDKILLRSSLYRIMQYNDIFSFVKTLIPVNVYYGVIYDEKWIDVQRTGNLVLVYPRNVPVEYIGFGTEQFSKYDVELMFYVFGTWEDLEDIIIKVHNNVESYIGGTDNINLERTVWVKITSEKNLQQDLRGAQKYNMHLEVMVYAPLKSIPPEVNE